MASAHATSIPIFWGTGTLDPLVKFQYAKDSADFLVNVLGVPRAPPSGECTGLSFNAYEGLGHSTCQQELDDLKTFITKAIPQ